MKWLIPLTDPYDRHEQEVRIGDGSSICYAAVMAGIYCTEYPERKTNHHDGEHRQLLLVFVVVQKRGLFLVGLMSYDGSQHQGELS